MRLSRLRIALPASLLLIAATARPASAWGPLGHRASAKLAEHHLTPEARAAIRELLEEGETLAEASTWPDEHRRDLPKSGHWHYVDVPLDQDRYDDRFTGDVPEKGYIVPKIREFRAVLKDRSRPIEERRFALRFLAHLIEDLHMPLHVGENHDKGGNATQVRFFDEGTNLHRLWDSDMLAHATPDETKWVQLLLLMDTPETRKRTMSGTVEDWATESLHAAKRAYIDPTTREMIRSGTKLGEAYQARHLPVARRRLYQSGIRLAMVLNEVFSNGGSRGKDGEAS